MSALRVFFLLFFFLLPFSGSSIVFYFVQFVFLLGFSFMQGELVLRSFSSTRQEECSNII